ALPAFAQATATDTCDASVTLTFNDVITPGNCAGNYSVTRTWTATDDCGNFSTATQTINVQDITAPVIAALPAPSTINCPALPAFAQATATDTCDASVTLTFNDVTTPGNCAGNYSVTRTWTATDDCGNFSTATQTINVQDITAPVIAALPAPSTINCPALPAFAQATATDTCDASVRLTFNDVTTPGNCAGNYSVTRTWTATDDCGNFSTATQTINVQDITAPVIAALPAPSTINCPALPAFAQATATDTCDASVTLTFNDVTTPGNCAGNYSVTRTWTATDDCGNTSTATQTINVQDITAPVIAALPAPSTINCPALPAFAQATATDTCDPEVTLTFNDVTTPGNCAGNYSVTRTWTATDDCGNFSTATQTINVQDITAPVIAALPAPSTINCPALPAFAQATATDTCDASVTLTFNDVTTPGNCAGNYSVTRTWTATDDCGNTSTATQTINVQDITAPVIAALPAPSTINCPALPAFAQATATDTCDPEVRLTFNDVTTPGNCAGNYSVTRTWTATDDCGNFSTATQTINVQDITAPVIAALPAPSTINCPALPAFAQATATDTCDPEVRLTFNDVTTPGNCAGNYSVTRTWTATDDCGNTSTATQTINVQDITAPVIAALPAPSTINCPALPAFAQATATDTCDASVTLTFNDVTTPGNCAGNYSVTRTWTATDDCGNTSTATQTINVQDITAPVIAALPAPSTINCPALPAFAQATATDTCDPEVTLTFNDVTTPGNCAGNYSVTRTWTATDDCGNTSTATQTINVQDITAPVIAALPAPSTINCPALPAFAQATATDTCDPEVRLTFNDVTTPGNCAGNYSVTRTWTATDDCGNFSTATQTINVQDITAPVIAALPAPSTINCPALPAFAQATATDTCDPEVRLTFNDVTTPGNCAGNYSVTRTWTATDDCGNTSTATQTINVQDITAPTLTCPANQTVDCGVEPVFGIPTISDGCDPNPTLNDLGITTRNNPDGSVTYTKTWSATDACGNTSATCSQSITVSACEGCTLGYWKNHTDRWCSAYTPSMLFGDVFVNAPSNLANLTLLQALNLGGGGIFNLARQGVAALLNACSDEVDFPAPYSSNPQSVIDAVNAAYLAGGSAPGKLATQLDVLNNTGCPLGGTSATHKEDSLNTSVGFTAFPVPFKDKLTIRYDFDYVSDVVIDVYNAQGVSVLSKTDTNSYLNKEVTLHLHSYKGQEQVYVVRLTTNRGSSVKKVMSSK
ncbi:T9SS type A sorting domain-containing protein, partial [Flavobacterium sp. XS2P12]|uniref:HYR-like domain-containing protein n=1 Tax=Flavobacterium melibiosi TaxID=3398734 RepID=UPI003A8C2073